MKLLRRLMSKRNNAGFTLIEVVISIALLGILLVGMTVFVGPVLRAAADTKGDIRASILAETINNYIARCLMNAQYVAVFDGVASEKDDNKDKTQQALDLNTIANHIDMKTLKDFMNEGSNSSVNEVRCISIRRQEDERTHEIKWMLDFNKVEPGIGDNYVITKSNSVFEDCFYDGLFPEISIEHADKVSSPGSKSSALKLTINVYSDQEMQSVSMMGDGYVQLITIDDSVKAGYGSVNDYIFFNTLDDIANAKEHTDIYIFYIARKTF